MYQQVIEKTDDLSLRSYVLINNLKQYAQVQGCNSTIMLNYDNVIALVLSLLVSLLPLNMQSCYC